MDVLLVIDQLVGLNSLYFSLIFSSALMCSILDACLNSVVVPGLADDNRPLLTGGCNQLPFVQSLEAFGNQRIALLKSFLDFDLVAI